MTGIIAQNVGRTSGLIKAASGGGGGVWTKIKTLTASGDGDLSFVDGTDDVVLDSTYPIYVFKFINIHPSADGERFSFQANASGGSGYNETITSTAFGAHNNEAGDTAALGYDTAEDQGQGTAFQFISNTLGNDNDQNMNGTLHLFAPSDTTFVKHFMAESNVAQNSDYTIHRFHAGYINTTSAITEIQFKMSSGNIDAGDICLFGLTT